MAPIALVAFAFLTVVMLVTATTTLVWMLDSWRTPADVDKTRFVPPDAPRLSFSLIVPARHETAVLSDTLDRLAALDHPSVQILAVVGHDDPDTTAVAEQAAQRHPDSVQVVVDHHWPKNKPKALNTALPHCHGDVVGVFDAEDEVALNLLAHVDACFDDPDVSVVQGGVQLMNFRSSWWALRNVLEYFFWFRSRLHRHARQRFIPLGGNTVFFRRDVLVEAGGWDSECLAEDCEVGVRLSASGARVTVAYDPELVTREETPHSIAAFLKQRTRWNQGFLQVLRKGEWRRLPSRRARALALYMLAMPFLQAATGLLLPVSLVAVFFLNTPILLALVMFTPLVMIVTTIAAECAGLHEFCRLYGFRARIRDYVRLVVSALPYQWVLGLAAMRAAVRDLKGVNSWEKTAHIGAHRQIDDGLVIDLRDSADAAREKVAS